MIERGGGGVLIESSDDVLALPELLTGAGL